MGKELTDEILRQWYPGIKDGDLRRVEEFARTFIQYFPQLEDLDTAVTEWGWLRSHWNLNKIRTVRRRQEIEKLEHIIQALRLLAKGSWWPWWGAIYAAQKAFEEKGDDADQVTQDLGYIATALDELNNINLPNDDGAAVRLENALARLREGATEDIDQHPEKGSINWEAVFAVDALRAVWWRNTGQDAPAKALNPASEFASYLRDGFSYLKVDASPVPAFRRWVAYENWRQNEVP